MTIKELCAVMRPDHCYVFTIDNKEYKTLALTNVGKQSLEKFHEEHQKLRALAEADEYTVKEIEILESRDGACMAVELEKKE